MNFFTELNKKKRIRYLKRSQNSTQCCPISSLSSSNEPAEDFGKAICPPKDSSRIFTSTCNERESALRGGLEMVRAARTIAQGLLGYLRRHLPKLVKNTLKQTRVASVVQRKLSQGVPYEPDVCG